MNCFMHYLCWYFTHEFETVIVFHICNQSETNLYAQLHLFKVLLMFKQQHAGIQTLSQVS